MFVYSRHPVFVRSLHHRTDTASQEVFWSTSSRCTTSEKFGLTYREIFPFSSISDLKLRKLDWRSYGNMVIQMRSCVCDWCELPPPHRHQPVTSPVKLDNSSKGTFTVKCVMFVHWAPDMGIPSMIQPASWIWQWNVLLQWCNKVLGGNRSFLGEIVAEAMREIMNKLINLPQNVDTGGATSWSSNLMSDIQMCQLTLIRDCHTLPSVRLVQNKAI